MAAETTADRIMSLLEPLAPEHGLELVSVEVTGGRRQPTVRVYLDREGGIDIEAIAEANKWISTALDDASPIPGAYTLEVSSPGLDRPLRKRADFVRFAGETARVQTAEPVEGRASFTGVLRGLDGDDVVLDVDGRDVRLPFELVSKARLKAEVDFSRLDSKRNEGGEV